MLLFATQAENMTDVFLKLNTEKQYLLKADSDKMLNMSSALLFIFSSSPGSPCQWF